MSSLQTTITLNRCIKKDPILDYSSFLSSNKTVKVIEILEIKAFSEIVEGCLFILKFLFRK